MEMTYVCSPLSAPSRAERLANAAKATTYMIWAEKEFGGRAVAPHAYLPYLLDDSVPEQRALALDFGLKLLGMCSRLVAFGDRLSAGMKKEIEAAHEKGIPVFYRTGICTESKPAVKRTPVIVMGAKWCQRLKYSLPYKASTKMEASMLSMKESI